MRRETGYIKWFNFEERWGLIDSPRRDEYVYVDIRDIQFVEEDCPLRLGLHVSFHVELTKNGLQARNIQLANTNIEPTQRLEYLESIERELESQSATAGEGSSGDRPSNDLKLIALGILENRIRLVSITPDGKYKYIDEEEKLHRILYITVSEVVSLKSAIEEFEYLINDSKVRESAFQNFFERFPNFILNDDYKKAHSHLVLARDSGELLIPDFVLEPIASSSLCDLLELKLPSSNIYVLQKNRMRYSAAVFEAAAQLREYGKYFDDEGNRSRFHQKYPHLQLYKPKMFVVIGRLGNGYVHAKRDIEAGLPDLNLRTYDEVLARMRWKLQKMQGGR